MLLILGIGFVSAASLAFEITLTRIFAVSQGHHFGFLAISVALLGIGASGTALALRPTPRYSTSVATLTRLALLFSISLVACYLAVNYLPFDSYRITLERIQLLYLILYYLALIVPFFLGGLILGLPLATMPHQTARIYAANLVGSGFGCIAALGALAIWGGTGAVFFSATLAACGALAFSIADLARLSRVVSVVLAISFFGLMLVPLAVFDLQTSPYKSFSQTLRLPDAQLIYRGWNAFSRVEVVESSAIRSAPGLSLTYRGAMPAQRALFKDAESTSPLTDAASSNLLDALPVALAYRLRPQARALIVEPGGGLEILAALNAGAREIVVVEENPLVAQVARQFAPHVFGDSRIHLVSEGVRSFLTHSHDQFDLVHLALSDSFRPSAAGAYSLGENYVYTQEAFRDYMNHLNDDGILIVSRWLQLPPTEEVRVGTLAVVALEGGTAQPSQNILALRSFSTLLLLVKRSPFTADEIQIARVFAEERQFDWVAYPGMRTDETNRFNVLRNDEYTRAFQKLLASDQREQFLTTYAYDISAPTDDRPFFYHFFKWEQTSQVLQLLGKLWQPFGGSGYLILLALLALSIIVSGVLIVMPLVSPRSNLALTKRKLERSNAAWLIYFACLGIGFLFVEIPLIQRFILFLDHPVYAFATVLFTLLVTSGFASSLSDRLPHRTTLVLLVGMILIIPLFLPFVFEMFLGYPLGERILVSFILLAPLGFLMGIPFPKGLEQLNKQAPSFVPLAWGINGCASVISSILATMGAMAWGFSTVMLAGAVVYAAAWVTIIFPASEGQKVRP